MAGMSPEDVRRKADNAELRGITEKQPPGRPSEYSPFIGNLLIDLMATGLSLTAAAAEIGFHRWTIYRWAEEHPEFSDALKLARGKRVLFLERGLLAAPDGPTVTSRIFALKNADPEEWRDKVNVEAKVENYLLEVPAEAKTADEWAQGTTETAK